jgi:alpha-ketoglutarate-dependent taurine dioxygenase
MSSINTTESITETTAKLKLSSTKNEIPIDKRVPLTEEQQAEIEKRLKDDRFKQTAIYGNPVVINQNGIIQVPDEQIKTSKYPEWLPTWDPAEKYEPYTVFETEDRGIYAHPDLKNLFPDGVKYVKKNFSPKFGTEVKGIQLSTLTDAGKNDLAKFVAERGVVIFRNQDLASKGPEFAAKFGEYFGPQHIHPTSGAPASTSQIHIVYRPLNGAPPYESTLKKKNKALGFHSDVSYEKQPPAITFLGLLEGPEIGGDTVFVDTVEAYNRISPEFQQILQRLKAVHQGVEQAKKSLESLSIVRREPVTNPHPIVRTIASTGAKALYINSGFVSEIEGLKEEESKAILGYLYDLLHTSVDLHIRANYEEGTVAVWDNRRTEHSPIFDWDSGERRHLFRITPRGEVPTL